MFWARGRRGKRLYAGSEPIFSAVVIILMLLLGCEYQVRGFDVINWNSFVVDAIQVPAVHEAAQAHGGEAPLARVSVMQG